jgi:hypothetical protein
VNCPVDSTAATHLTIRGIDDHAHIFLVDQASATKFKNDTTRSSYFQSNKIL